MDSLEQAKEWKRMSEMDSASAEAYDCRSLPVAARNAGL